MSASNPLPESVPVASVALSLFRYSPEDDGLTVGDAQIPCFHLQNSALLGDLSGHFLHSPELQCRDIQWCHW